MNLELLSSTEGEKEHLEEAIKNLPLSFKGIDSSLPGVVVTPEEMELKDLVGKVSTTLHSYMGHAIMTGSEFINKEELKHFLELLEEQANRYLKAVEEIRASGIKELSE